MMRKISVTHSWNRVTYEQNPEKCKAIALERLREMLPKEIKLGHLKVRKTEDTVKLTVVVFVSEDGGSN